ncbi:MAG: cyclic nucleotide-binding domain-containing protein [Xanthobacteraceae bacterium]
MDGKPDRLRQGRGMMSGGDIDMRLFARKAGASVNFPAGSVAFAKGDPGPCMYVIQSGVIEMVIGEKVVEVCGANEAIGFMSMIDGSPRSSTARVKEACELSVIDQRKFRFMVDEVPNFALLHHGRDGPPHSRHGAGDVTQAPRRVSGAGTRLDMRPHFRYIIANLAH